MIEPISQTSFTPARLEFTAKSVPTSQASTLSSLNNSCGSIKSFFRRIFEFFKSLLLFFFCCRSKVKDSSEIAKEYRCTPEVKDDPFYQLVYDDMGNIKRKDSFHTLFVLFKFLGETSVFRWFAHPQWLKNQFDKIDMMIMHPLECLFCLLYSKELIKAFNQLKNKTGIKSFDDKLWDLLIDKLERSFRINNSRLRIPEFVFDQEKDPCYAIAPLLPGFCKMLNLNAIPLKTLVENKEWKKFINEIFNQRKAQINY